MSYNCRLISLSLALAIVFFTIKHKYFYKTRKYFPCFSAVRAVSGSASGAAVARLRCGTESHVSYGHVSRASSRRVTRRGMETSQYDTRALSCPGLVVTDKTVRSQGQVFSRRFLPRNIKYTAGSGAVRRQRRLQKIAGVNNYILH